MAANRRLAAIMAIDVVGYSRLMGEDEAGTARAVRERREAAQPVVAQFFGRIVKTVGDGLLLEFPSVVAAVECAVAIQHLMSEGADAPDAKRLVYRIGVHLGDMLIDGDDIIGEGVNIAARLEGICDPGGVLISGAAYEHIRGRVEAEFIDLGEQRLKNISRPVRAYALAGGALAASAVPRPPRLSLVVLPFANMGGGTEHEYFVDGVTESLTTDLSRIRGALVIARNTAYTYRERSIDVKKIGRELNVRYVLEGSVQRGENRVRVNVQLVDTEAGAHIWAERFDKPLTDLFDLQDAIVARLAGALNAQLVEAEARRAENAVKPDSTDLYFQGQASLNKGLTPDNVARARGYFDRALGADPDNVEALVSSAFADAAAGILFFGADRDANRAAAEAKLTKVLAVVPDHAFGHSTLGMLYIHTRRVARGIAECEHALRLDRNLASAHGFIGLGEILINRAERTEAHVVEALRLSPRDPSAYIWMKFAGDAKDFLGLQEEAVLWRLRSIETNPNFPLNYFSLAANLAKLDRGDEAHAAARAGLGLDPNFTASRAQIFFSAFADTPTYLEWVESAVEGMRKAGVPD